MELEVVDGAFAVDMEIVGGSSVDIELPATPSYAGVALAIFQGATGPPGPTGVSGFAYAQSSPSSNWIVTHTLGRYPLSSEITVAGEVVHTDITYPDVFTVVVTFASPQSGSLRLT